MELQTNLQMKMCVSYGFVDLPIKVEILRDHTFNRLHLWTIHSIEARKK